MKKIEKIQGRIIDFGLGLNLETRPVEITSVEIKINELIDAHNELIDALESSQNMSQRDKDLQKAPSDPEREKLFVHVPSHKDIWSKDGTVVMRGKDMDETEASLKEYHSTSSWEEEFDKRFNSQNDTHAFDRCSPECSTDINEIKSFIKKVVASERNSLLDRLLSEVGTLPKWKSKDFPDPTVYLDDVRALITSLKK